MKRIKELKKRNQRIRKLTYAAGDAFSKGDLTAATDFLDLAAFEETHSKKHALLDLGVFPWPGQAETSRKVLDDMEEDLNRIDEILNTNKNWSNS